jgi:hypothetical protein
MFPFDSQHCQLKVTSSFYRNVEVLLFGSIEKDIAGSNDNGTNEHPGNNNY